MTTDAPTPKKGRILTGDRPTGQLHLGHYVGTLRNRVALQHDYDMFIFVADYHLLTTRLDNLRDVRDNVRSLVLDYLAVGIDPEITNIHLQSLVPETAELHLIFSMLNTVPRLQRVPSLKEVMQNLHIETPSYGLLGYPVLQAADILIVRGNLVPVGRDQASHLEVTRETARRFNDQFGTVFPVPEPMLGDVLVGTDNQAKMSKSLGNTIFLTDSAAEVQRKVMTMYTDPTHVRKEDPGHVEGNPVFMYLDIFDPERAELAALQEHYQRGGLGDVEVKRRLIRVLNQFMDPIRERRVFYEGRPQIVNEILLAGSARARREGQETLRMAREAMGFDYLMKEAGVHQ